MDNGKPASIGFNQAGWEVNGNVYNVNGDLILNEHSTSQDLAKTLSGLSQELASLQSLPQDLRQQLDAQLGDARQAAEKSQPEKSRIISNLESANETLASMKGSIEGAWDLAKTIAKVSKWVAAFLL